MEDFNVEDSLVEEGPMFYSLFSQYEKVVVNSLITSFGLDFFIRDRHGGDVDTINTVRDETVEYKNKVNEYTYESHEKYVYEDHHRQYHRGNYTKRREELNKEKESGNLYNAYTGEKMDSNEILSLDHTISGKEIHNDPGRILAGLDGEKLANVDSNLNPTDTRINSSKNSGTTDEFVNRHEENDWENFEEVDAQKMKDIDKKARGEYNRSLSTNYYTSSRFLNDTARASLKKGTQMGIRQCLGLILSEIWFNFREEFPRIAEKMEGGFDLKEFLLEVSSTFKNSVKNIMEKYKEFISSFKDGVIGGVLSSISETIMNIFFTTARNVGKILRESWASIVEAVKILVFNPDGLPFGEMIRSVAKIISTAISVICGSLVNEALSNFVTTPILSEIVPIFAGTMTTGILSISMLYFLDNSELVQRIVDFANKLKTEFDYKLEYYKAISERLNEYTAELANIDLEQFEIEIEEVRSINFKLNNAETDGELNVILNEIIEKRGIDMPFKNLDELDDFLNDEDSVLII